MHMEDECHPSRRLASYQCPGERQEPRRWALGVAIVLIVAGSEILSLQFAQHPVQVLELYTLFAATVAMVTPPINRLHSLRTVYG